MAQNLGGRIAELLTQYNMTQRELADKAGITEVSMSRYIKGDRVPKGTTLANIATALHTTIARNASQMSPKQRRELINALLESDEI